MIRAAGLEAVYAEFPEDVLAAAQYARDNRGGFAGPADPYAEPFPPMFVPEGGK
jgi:hypothetical protein